MARGDGISKVAGARPSRHPLPEGKEGGDARGATWPTVILGGSVVIGMTLAAVVYGAVQLELAGEDPAVFVTKISGAMAALLVAIVVGLVTKLMNNSGRALRNQQQLAANQVASSDRVDVIASAVKDCIVEVRRLDKRLDDAAPAAAAGDASAVAKELALLRQSVDTVAGKVGRANVTGGHPVLRPGSPLLPPEPPRRGASDARAQDPLDTSQAWHTGLTGQGEALPPTPPRRRY